MDVIWLSIPVYFMSWLCQFEIQFWDDNFGTITGLPLNDFVRHFEPAFYDRLILENDIISPNRLKKRSVQNDSEAADDAADSSSYHTKPILFNVTAHNR